MAKTGPRPKPKATIERSGSNQIYNRQDDLEVPVGMPDKPEWLDEIGGEVWDETARQLFTLGVLTKIDKGGLALYCHAWSQFRRIEKEYKAVVITTATGAKKINPYYEASGKAWDKIVKLSKEFGLTPASRAGLGAEPKRKADKSSSRFFIPGKAG